MSLYGDNKHERDKEYLYDVIIEYIESYSVSDVIDVLADAIRSAEGEQEERDE